MRRRKIDTENLGENTPISLRLPKKILDWIQDVCDNNPDLYTGRNHFVETACRYYLNSAPCPNCGNLNQRDAVSCSYCEARLPAFQEMIEQFYQVVSAYENMLQEGFDIFYEYHKIVNEIKSIIEDLPGELQEHLVEEFKRHLSLCDDFSVSSLVFYNYYNDIGPGFVYSELYKEHFAESSSLESALRAYFVFNFSRNKESDKRDPEEFQVIRHLAYYHACKKILSDDPANHLTSEYLKLRTPLESDLIKGIQAYNERLLLACEELNVFKRLLLILKDSKKE